MKRAALLGSGLLAGVVVGAVLMLAAQSFPADTRPTVTETTPAAPSTTPAPVAPSTTFKSPPLSDQVLLVWTSGGLPEGLADQVSKLEGVTAVTAVRSNLVHLRESLNIDGEVVGAPRARLVIPLEAMAFDPANYAAFVSKKEAATFAELAPGEIILGATSANLRGLGPGGVLVLEDETRLTVAAVVDDLLIGAAELAVPIAEAELIGVETERYLLVRYSGMRKDLESSIRQVLPEGIPVRIRAPGETPVLRHGDAVLPQVLIKEVFGEFAYRPDGGLGFAIDPDWVEANIVTSEVPILGTVTCHRNLLPGLSAAMSELVETNLAFLVHPEEFRGCFNPRFIAGRKGISRHAWGAALDINIVSNPEGLESAQDPRLIAVMERWGFTSGHEWLIPDPGHFEYLQPPQQSADE